MSRFFFFLIFLLLPAGVYAQTTSVENHGLSLVIKNNTRMQETPEPDSQNLYIVEPLLTRNKDIHVHNGDAFSFGNSPQAAFFSSLIIPGSGQLASKSWLRAGLFIAIEAAGIYMAVEQRNKAIKRERTYEHFADVNWSVVEYSNWLIHYHETHGINNPYIEQLRNELAGVEPSFDTRVDWDAVNINLLRNVERNTPYLTSDAAAANFFSHTMPAYGSQQYYELIAKYYQFQAGWRDYNSFHDAQGHTTERFLIDSNGASASTFFFDAAASAKQFNADYRRSRTIATLLLVNHVISAFDTYFTVKMKQNRLQASSSISPGRQFVLSYQF